MGFIDNTLQGQQFNGSLYILWVILVTLISNGLLGQTRAVFFYFCFYFFYF